MKVRSGFVSNSSSSSFVLYGFKVSLKDAKKLLGVDGDDLYDAIDRCGVEYVDDYEGGFVFFGKGLANWDDYGYAKEGEITLDELASAAEAVKAKFGLSGEPKFYAGTRSC